MGPVPSVCSFRFQHKHLAEPVHHVGFMFHKGVGIAVERNGRVLMTENFGERLYVHATFEGAGGKGMPQGMKALVRNIQSFQEQFKTSLVGADGYRLSVCGYHEGRRALSLYTFQDRQQLFRQWDHVAGCDCFRLVYNKSVLTVVA